MKGKLLLRLLAGTIDLMLIFFPCYMVFTVLGVEGLLFQLLPQLLFAVYNVVAITSFEGKTVGKYFARLSVCTEEGSALHLGIREAAKLLYFLPQIGIVFAIISSLIVVLFKKSLHDWIGSSRVLLDVERKQLERGDRYEKQLVR